MATLFNYENISLCQIYVTVPGILFKVSFVDITYKSLFTNKL